MIGNCASKWLLLAVFLGLTAGCEPKRAPAPPPPKPAAPVGNAEWAAFANRFIEDYFKLQPFFAVNAGRHEFDGKMPDWSTAGIQQEVNWLKRMRTQAAQFDAGKLVGPQTPRA